MSFIFWLTEASSFGWGSDFVALKTISNRKQVLSVQVKQFLCVEINFFEGLGGGILVFDLDFGFRKQTIGFELAVQMHPSKEEEIFGWLPTDILPQTGSS